MLPHVSYEEFPDSLIFLRTNVHPLLSTARVFFVGADADPRKNVEAPWSLLALCHYGIIFASCCRTLSLIWIVECPLRVVRFLSRLKLSVASI